jgi:hypothetical protein
LKSPSVFLIVDYRRETYILSEIKPATKQDGNEINHTYWYRLWVIEVVSQVKEHIWHKLRHIIWVCVDEGTESKDSGVAHFE